MRVKLFKRSPYLSLGIVDGEILMVTLALIPGMFVTKKKSCPYSCTNFFAVLTPIYLDASGMVLMGTTWIHPSSPFSTGTRLMMIGTTIFVVLIPARPIKLY